MKAFLKRLPRTRPRLFQSVYELIRSNREHRNNFVLFILLAFSLFRFILFLFLVSIFPDIFNMNLFFSSSHLFFYLVVIEFNSSEERGGKEENARTKLHIHLLGKSGGTVNSSIIYIYIKESRKIVLVTPFITQERLYRF